MAESGGDTQVVLLVGVIAGSGAILSILVNSAAEIILLVINSDIWYLSRCVTRLSQTCRAPAAQTRRAPVAVTSQTNSPRGRHGAYIILTLSLSATVA